ncbi:MAG: helix-turn-helix transcriptional regulator [Burkholderiaceae bacterium]|jgi:transcriptional regulator with XRE-family HTH domain|nr:helix-turn-helix transcriptional regulator [Burkholderiaceae bacterium]
MDLSAWVRAARQHGKLTMQQLADHLSLTKGAVYHWEHGNNNPSFEQVMRIAELTAYPVPAAAQWAEAPGSLQELSGAEGMLVGLYRLLGDDERQQVLHQVKERAAHYTLTPRTPDHQQ